MKKYELWIAFFAGFAITITIHVLQVSMQYPPLTPELSKLCVDGKFHPDCPE